MGRRLTAIGSLLLVVIAASLVPGGPVRVARAADYELETEATYSVEPTEGAIAVDVGMTFTNTTPDPAGRFSVFEEIKLAIHDEATEVTASDDDGEMEVAVARENDVNVATVQLRDPLRFEESVELSLDYVLPDGEGAQLRVRPSHVVFAAWGFGTSGTVEIVIPAAYEVRVDGDPLTETSAGLTSGPIEDPSQWLARVTAVRPADYVTLDAVVPLSGGTADVHVRAFEDDEAWGERTLDLVQRALPLLEEEIGMPYPRLGPLSLTETVADDTSGFAESSSGSSEILVAFDQPDFTVVHQLGHVWLSPPLVESRWISEGLASDAAARVAAELKIEPPYDPAAVAQERAADAFPLDAWAAGADPGGEGYGYAASWSFVTQLREAAGDEALQIVLARVAASLGPYAATDVEPAPPDDGTGEPAVPLTTRGFLDHLEAVTGEDHSEAFAAMALTEGDTALLPDRAEARAQYAELVEAAGAWGAPDAIQGAMTAWSFDAAISQMDAAQQWLAERDRLLAEMEAAGLSTPERLQQAYRSYGGGPEARAELEAERAVVEAYTAAAEDVNAERSLLERIGLIGGPDPAQQLQLANGRFADGDLQGAVEAITESRRILSSAETGGVVRLVSVAIVVLVLLGLAAYLVRRRAAYTPAR